MRRSSWVVPLFLLMSACAPGTPSVESEAVADDAAAEEGVEAEEPVTQLAITDCGAAAALAGDLILGMEPVPKGREESEGNLVCAWWNTKASSSFSISVSTGGSNGMLPDILDTVIQQSGQTKVPARAFEAKEGGAGWEVATDASGHRTAQLNAYLPDATILLIHILPTSAGGGLLVSWSCSDPDARLIGTTPVPGWFPVRRRQQAATHRRCCGRHAAHAAAGRV